MELILMMNKTKKYLIMNIVFFFVFGGIYYVLDINANGSYAEFMELFGLGTVVMHIVMNLLLAIASSIVFTWSYISMQVHKRDSKWTNIPVLGVFIGFLTFGCTPCVVALLSIFGITFVPMVLPNANILWKLLVLLLIVFSGWMTIVYANKGCKVENNS